MSPPNTNIIFNSRKPNRTRKEVDMEEREVEEEHPRKEVNSLYGADAGEQKDEQTERKSAVVPKMVTISVNHFPLLT